MTLLLKTLQAQTLQGNSVAIVDATGSHTYASLYERARRMAQHISKLYPPSAAPTPVPFLFEASADYVLTLWAIWLAGHIAVPIHPKHPQNEIDYILMDLGQQTLIKEVVLTTPATYEMSTPEKNQAALIIYTSGSTGRPKGAVHSFESLETHISTLVEAWGWSSADRIVNVLPLNHVHGLINVLGCTLWSGARCYMLPKFDPKALLELFEKEDITLFMAVPTVYSRLANYWQSTGADAQKKHKSACQKLRLMVSGSAALNLPLMELWQELTGHVLLERYGMTETGMMLSNPLHGRRIPGTVGKPLPSVEIRLVAENGDIQAENPAIGEIQTKGTHLFSAYWQKPAQTQEVFTTDQWFKTGDWAKRDENGVYTILGRLSTDIIKTAGYKVSALEIESKLLAHPSVSECAVVALPNAEYGEVVCAAIVSEYNLNFSELKQWAKRHLAPYKVPQRWHQVQTLPRNALGKVVKKDLQKLLS